MLQYRVFDAISGHYLGGACSTFKQHALDYLESSCHSTMYDRHEIHEFLIEKGGLTKITVFKVKVSLIATAQIEEK